MAISSAILLSPIKISSHDMPYKFQHVLPKPPEIDHVTKIDIDAYYDPKMGWDLKSLSKLQNHYYNSFLKNYPDDTTTNGIPDAIWTLMPVIKKVSERDGCDSYIVASLSVSESFDYLYPVSSAGDYGLMGINLKAHRKLVSKYGLRHIFDPETNLELGCNIFRQEMFNYHGNINKALAAYNGGNVRVDTGTVLKSTKGYIARTLRRAEKIKRMEAEM